jgi:hypothetical protein
MRPVFYVPKTTPLGDLLRDFRRRKVHLAIVLDEYGGTAGLVTLEDILECWSATSPTEHEKPDAASSKNQRQHVEADARIDIAELNRLADLSLPEDESLLHARRIRAFRAGPDPRKGRGRRTRRFEDHRTRRRAPAHQPPPHRKTPGTQEVSAETGNEAQL